MDVHHDMPFSPPFANFINSQAGVCAFDASGAPVMDREEARDYIGGLLNKNLRVYTTDGRLFWGSFKCTDADKNIVLAYTYEYRQPSSKQRADAAAQSPDVAITLDMTSRYLGLVVVPGHHIIKMEVEHFASQLKKGIRV
ncbi:hypothetical protein G7046_g3242 [Stylonectria norvegica]|nr:hypothetical protein G7046_g3242 [Stylonectria norvegica]